LRTLYRGGNEKRRGAGGEELQEKRTAERKKKEMTPTTKQNKTKERKGEHLTLLISALTSSGVAHKILWRIFSFVKREAIMKRALRARRWNILLPEERRGGRGGREREEGGREREREEGGREREREG
jgi:hypothetical protein